MRQSVALIDASSIQPITAFSNAPVIHELVKRYGGDILPELPLVDKWALSTILTYAIYRGMANHPVTLPIAAEEAIPPHADFTSDAINDGIAILGQTDWATIIAVLAFLGQ